MTNPLGAGRRQPIEREIERALAFSRDLEELYSSWWVRLEPGGTQFDSHAELGVTFHESEEWRAVERDGAGGLVVARDANTGFVRAGEWLVSHDDRVLVQRRRRWLQDGFEWATSS